MRGIGAAISAALGVAVGFAAFADGSVLPDGIAWAYPTAAEKTPFNYLSDEKIYRVEGSTLALSGKQISESEDAIDWLPGDHPKPPPVVFHGNHAAKLEPCAACHESNGLGFLGVPNLAGLPPDYIIEQIKEFRAGRRHALLSDRPGTGAVVMAGMAAAVSDEELTEAAQYYGSIKRHGRSIRVIETDTVPATKGNYYGWLELVPGQPKEAIGSRIILVAEDFERMWIGDPHAIEIAYVPPGSVERGKKLVLEAKVPCTACHGSDLKGVGNVPSLAGRDPIYLARTMWDIKSGARSGPAVEPMVERLRGVDPEAIMNMVAYLASLEP